MRNASIYRRLIVQGPTAEELRASRIPDHCLDILVVGVKDVNGFHYDVPYYPNDVHGAYVSVSYPAKASPEDVKNIAKMLAAICRGWVDERGIAG